MNRRRFLTAFAALSASLAARADNPFALPENSGALPEQSAKPDIVKPYLAVGPYADDQSRVFMFMSYECPYCEQTWYGMGEWGRTLPEPFRFVYVPLYTGNKRLDAAATGFYIVRSLAPQRIAEYQRLAFEAAKTARSSADFAQVLHRMGFSRSQIAAAAADKQTQNRIARAMLLVRRYRVTATPFFTVGGRYTTHAGFTGGDYRVLVQLMNGLVSDVLQSTHR